MVAGLKRFIERFKDYPDCYTIIGGTACDILMREADIDFRATKDIDMIVIMEARYKQFTKVLWDYIIEGGYRFGWKNSDEVHFYRFTEPKPGYPSMIELFSREPDYIKDVPTGIVPLHIDDETSSLSAILLNDDFYSFMLEGRRTILGASVLGAEYLIPFKMYAWLNLKDRKSRGEHVNERDLKKHKNDVFRLLQIVDPQKKIDTKGIVNEAVRRFIQEIREESLPLKQLGISVDVNTAIEYLESMYI